MAIACSSPAEPPAAPPAVDPFAARREALVGVVRAEGIADARVLEALGRVERHRFVPRELEDAAYEDRPLPIGHEQTISQPYIVALMTELARVAPPCRVLEVGTGSGYQAAVLAEVGCDVFSIEIVAPLADEARERLRSLGYLHGAPGHAPRVRVRTGDGYRGWTEEAPFDAILITAAPPALPEPLPPQLRVGGRLVAPVGEVDGAQQLIVVERTGETSYDRRTAAPVRFVPMTGEAQER
jgi:protein-L-isoaspartate(D-aspartate) O-methyltransferase